MKKLLLLSSAILLSGAAFNASAELPEIYSLSVPATQDVYLNDTFQGAFGMGNIQWTIHVSNVNVDRTSTEKVSMYYNDVLLKTLDPAKDTEINMTSAMGGADDGNGSENLFDPTINVSVMFNFGEQAGENEANKPDPDYLKDGQYRIEVPAGIFIQQAEDDGAPVALPAASVTYTYHNSVLVATDVVVDPASGSNVTDLKNIYVYFPSAKNPFGLDYNSNGGATLMGPKDTKMKGGTYPTVIRGDKLGFQYKYTNSANVWEDGTYTFTVKAGELIVDQAPYEQPITAVYTIGQQVSVKTIYGLDEADQYTVVALNGVVVACGDKNVLSALEPGYYIINGKKVLVK